MGFWYLPKRDLWAKVLQYKHKVLSLNPKNPRGSLGVIVYTGAGVEETGGSLDFLVASPHLGSVRVIENTVEKEGTECLPLSTCTLNTHTCTYTPTTTCNGEPLIFLFSFFFQ